MSMHPPTDTTLLLPAGEPAVCAHTDCHTLACVHTRPPAVFPAVSQEELSGTLGGIFYFHSLSQVGLLMVNNRKVRGVAREELLR